MTEKQYADMILFRKKEFNLNGWNALDMKAEDLIKAAEATEKDLPACIKAMKYHMLEGDTFLKGNEHTATADLTVRYYCDNLRPDRRHIF